MEEFRDDLLKKCLSNQIKGTVLLSNEGINGTISGETFLLKKIITYLKTKQNLCDLNVKFSHTIKKTFNKMKVKIKREIVTMGVENIFPTEITGKFIKPENWEEFLNDPNLILIDTRNNYETKIGRFRGSITPNTSSFREFPDWVKNNLDSKKDKKIAMYCTGGIRCEKASSFLKKKGFKKVYQLEGGILKYIETEKNDNNCWQGDCFVFDDRVSLKCGLKEGNYDMCHACRMPISEEEKNSKYYQAGISCPNCYNKTTDNRKKRFRERQKQILLKKRHFENE